MKQLAALIVVFACAACAQSGGSSNSKPADDGLLGQENRTALSMFYGDYTTVMQDDEAISATADTLTCSTAAKIGNSVAAYPISGDTTGGQYAMGTLTDPATGEVVKSDDVWVAPGALYFDDTPMCSDYHMSVFEDRGTWRMGDNFVEYTFQGTLLRDGEEVTFDDSLRAEKLDNGQVKVTMDSKTSDGEFTAAWTLQRR